MQPTEISSRRRWNMTSVEWNQNNWNKRYLCELWTGPMPREMYSKTCWKAKKYMVNHAMNWVRLICIHWALLSLWTWPCIIDYRCEDRKHGGVKRPHWCHFDSLFQKTPVIAIDYRCDNGRFWVSTSLWSSPNPTLLSSSETRVNLGIKSRKVLIWIRSMSESHWWHLFQRNLKTWGTTLLFRNWQVPTPV
jgi:hypothetical protein